MIIRSSLILVSLALPLIAQDNATQKKGTVGSFYKAYFLDKEDSKNKKSTAQAIELYTAFLADKKDHKLAGRAAANCVVLIYSTGDVKKAEAFAKKFGSLMAAAEAKDAERGGVLGAFRGFGRGRGGERPANPNQDLIDRLMALHEKAGDAEKTRLSGAIARLGGARDLMMARFRGGGFGGRGGGGRGGGFGGRRGGRGGLTKPNIAEMKLEDAKRAVERMATAAERLIDRMAANGQTDKADALEAKLDKIQDLVDDGKLKEAQKIIDSIDTGGGQAGGQGGRRRRR